MVSSIGGVLITHIPAGLGVIEAGVPFTPCCQNQFPRAEIHAALIGLSRLYFLLPLALALRVCT